MRSFKQFLWSGFLYQMFIVNESDSKIRFNLERNGGAMTSLVMKVFEIWMQVFTIT